MGTLNRRDFLKALGITGGMSAVAACGFDQNYYRQPIEHILPYVVRPDQIIPGNPVFFATTVTTGALAYPVLARHREGRVTNVGANAAGPLYPAVPRSALLELQKAYSPDRLKKPLSKGAETDWGTSDQPGALKAFGDAVGAARTAGKKVAYLGPQRGGAIVELVKEFTGGNAVFWEPLAREAEALAAEKLFGARMLPAYDLTSAQYVLSFGADFLGTWNGPDTAHQYADARNPNKGKFVARFALVSPHQGQTGANADDWHAVAPGSEAKVALAVARLVAEAKASPLAAMLSAGNVEEAAKASGLTAEAIKGLAEQFVKAPAAVALPGGVVGSSKAGTDLAAAVYLLNLAAGMGGVTFGMGRHYAGPLSTTAELEALIAAMKAGEIGVILVDEIDPAFSLPAAMGFVEAAKGVTLVSFNSHPDHTTALAQLVLPTAGPLEDWGDEEPQAGLHLLRQPAMTPLHAHLSLGDVLLSVGKALKPAEPAPADAAAPAAVPAAPAADAAPVATAPAALGFAAENWREYVRAYWKRDVHPKAYRTRVPNGDGSVREVSNPAGHAIEFEAWFTEALQAGFVDCRADFSAPPAPLAYTFAADGVAEGAGDYVLVAYPHPFRYDGRYANQPWAQEVPDPMTGHVWDSWVEINPETAEKLGLSDNDLVEVVTSAGKIQLGVEIHPKVVAGAIAIAFGQGRTSGGRYENGVGQNVVALMGAVKDASGALAWTQQKASVTKVGKRADLVSTFGADRDFNRQIGAEVDAAEIAKVGDEPAEHPGHMTGVHVYELDKRLTEREEPITDFYPIPQHPTYRFGMAVDTNACNGCGVCALACYAENNLPVVGKLKVGEGREMGWIRVARYFADEGDNPTAKNTRFVPLMCQQCGHAPCESVCPVLATYHTIDGLNAMIYNRCVGTRYCSNNCPYKARRFNFHSYHWPEPFNLQLNPDVSTRTMGVMEKCTFCVQRIRAVKSAYRNVSFTTTVPDEALQRLPACAEACPSGALTFGNLNDEASAPTATRKSGRSYELFADLHTFPAVNYLGKASFHHTAAHHGDAAADAGGGEHAAPAGAEAAHGSETNPAPAEHH
jgi:Fe-S-cluster-containing dehydrogenase component/anaerobic selenocysteine-containing dehydrogenase